VHTPEATTVKATALYLSAITGYLGLVLMLWQYVLGAKSVFGLIFDDLAPVLKVHSWLGKYGTLLILAHPLLVMYAYGEDLFYTFVPHIGTHFERHVTLGRIAFLLTLMIWITSAVVRGKIKFRPWKYIHYLIYLALPFGFLHVPDVGTQFMTHQAIKIYLYSLVAVFALFTLLRARSLLNLDKQAYTVTRQRQLNDDVYMLELAPQSMRIAPRRGQYIYLKLGYISEDHPFSVAQYNETTGAITIIYRVFGAFTVDMSCLQAGQKLWAGGPHGAFLQELSHSGRPRVFVAGGIGVTPFIDDILRPRGAQEQWLFYSNSTQTSAPLVSELRQALGDHLVTNYSQEKNEVGAESTLGRISPESLSAKLAEPTIYDYYLCGTEAMLDTVSAHIVALGVPSSQIHREAFGW
jgi:predicted ferric reductase